MRTRIEAVLLALALNAGQASTAAAATPTEGPPPSTPPTTESSAAAPNGEPAARATAADEPLPPTDQPPTVAEPAPGTDESAPTQSAAKETREGDLSPCQLERQKGEKTVDRARRGLWSTACHAALWFDGLFGEERHPEAARNTTGRVELSYIYSEYEGSKIPTRLNFRMRFPNLSNRVEVFAGRDNENQFIRDRNEGFALRSQFLDLENEDRWVAGFGYGLPGTYRQRTDFRIGAKGGRTPEVFVQGRLRHNWYLGERDLWHFRETIFWSNRDGFGSTTSLDFDHLLSRTLLARWGTVGTFSEATHGLDWRSVLVFYKELSPHRALANEIFLRGETDAEVGVTEYGARLIYRQTILHRDWLWGELIGGYSWPRFHLEERRSGSAAIGFGFEMLFGRSETGP